MLVIAKYKGNKMERKFKREEFLKVTGLATFLAVLSSFFPFKFFNNRKRNKSKVSIKINPFAVKRRNKV